MRRSRKRRLQRHRRADFRRRRDRALDISAVTRGDDRDPVRDHQGFCLIERQPAASGRAIEH